MTDAHGQAITVPVEDSPNTVHLWISSVRAPTSLDKESAKT